MYYKKRITIFDVLQQKTTKSKSDIFKNIFKK